MHVRARAALVQANVVGRNMWEGVRWARMGALRGDANELAVRPKMVYMVVEARVVGAVGVRDPPRRLVVDHGALVAVQVVRLASSAFNHARWLRL